MKTKLFGLVSLALAATSTFGATANAEGAWGPFTANIGLTTDYRFRGQSQSQKDPAISGGIDYASESGFFAGVWASNVDFNDAADTYMELDIYAGLTKALDDKTTGSLKVIYYAYPTADYPAGANHNDYLEIIGTLTHDFGGATGTLELAVSPDYFLESSDSVELSGALSVPVADSFLFFDGGVSASARYGYQWIHDNTTFGTPDYGFYDIGVTAKVWKAAVDLRWVDTDLSDAECFGGTNLCEGGFVASVTIALP